MNTWKGFHLHPEFRQHTEKQLWFGTGLRAEQGGESRFTLHILQLGSGHPGRQGRKIDPIEIPALLGLKQINPGMQEGVSLLPAEGQGCHRGAPSPAQVPLRTRAHRAGCKETGTGHFLSDSIRKGKHRTPRQSINQHQEHPECKLQKQHPACTWFWRAGNQHRVTDFSYKNTESRLEKTNKIEKFNQQPSSTTMVTTNPCPQAPHSHIC